MMPNRFITLVESTTSNNCSGDIKLSSKFRNIKNGGANAIGVPIMKITPTIATNFVRG